ncbi:hypothetical protein ACWGJ9_11835 [Curtobacterium citreum]
MNRANYPALPLATFATVVTIGVPLLNVLTSGAFAVLSFFLGAALPVVPLNQGWLNIVGCGGAVVALPLWFAIVADAITARKQQIK